MYHCTHFRMQIDNNHYSFLPIIDVEFLPNQDENVEEFLSTMFQIKDEICNITRAQSKQKENFDRRHFFDASAIFMGSDDIISY